MHMRFPFAPPCLQKWGSISYYINSLSTEKGEREREDGLNIPADETSAYKNRKKVMRTVTNLSRRLLLFDNLTTQTPF